MRNSWQARACLVPAHEFVVQSFWSTCRLSNFKAPLMQVGLALLVLVLPQCYYVIYGMAVQKARQDSVCVLQRFCATHRSTRAKSSQSIVAASAVLSAPKPSARLLARKSGNVACLLHNIPDQKGCRVWQSRSACLSAIPPSPACAMCAKAKAHPNIRILTQCGCSMVAFYIHCYLTLMLYTGILR